MNALTPNPAPREAEGRNTASRSRIVLPWQGRTSRKAAKETGRPITKARKSESTKEEETLLDESLLSTVRFRGFALSCFRDCFLCVFASLREVLPGRRNNIYRIEHQVAAVGIGGGRLGVRRKRRRNGKELDVGDDGERGDRRGAEVNVRLASVAHFKNLRFSLDLAARKKTIPLQSESAPPLIRRQRSPELDCAHSDTWQTLSQDDDRRAREMSGFPRRPYHLLVATHGNDRREPEFIADLLSRFALSPLSSRDEWGFTSSGILCFNLDRFEKPP